MTKEPKETDVLSAVNPHHYIEAAMKAAALSDPVVLGPDGRAYALVPDGMKVSELPDRDWLPTYPEATVKVDVKDSLIGYVNRFSDQRSVIFADYETLTVGAVLDWHNHNMRPDAGDIGAKSGPRKHVAQLRLRPSEAFKRWDAIQGKMIDQAEFASFLEENSEDIVDPDPTVMIEISRDLEANIGSAFKSSIRLENGDRALRFDTETRIATEVVIPREFKLNIPLWDGEDSVLLRCAFRWRARAEGLMLGFEWRRVEYLRRGSFAEIAHAVAEATACPVFMGRVI